MREVEITVHQGGRQFVTSVIENSRTRQRKNHMRRSLIACLVAACLTPCVQAEENVPRGVATADGLTVKEQQVLDVNKDEFRLTVIELLVSENERFTQLVIETHGDYGWAIANGRDEERVTAMRLNPDGRTRLVRIPVLVDRVSHRGSGSDLVKTVVASGSVVREVPQGKDLTATLALTAKNGVYPADELLVIGTLDGQELTLIVGNKPKQLEER